MHLIFVKIVSMDQFLQTCLRIQYEYKSVQKSQRLSIRVGNFCSSFILKYSQTRCPWAVQKPVHFFMIEISTMKKLNLFLGLYIMTELSVNKKESFKLSSFVLDYLLQRNVLNESTCLEIGLPLANRQLRAKNYRETYNFTVQFL